PWVVGCSPVESQVVVEPGQQLGSICRGGGRGVPDDLAACVRRGQLGDLFAVPCLTGTGFDGIVHGTSARRRSRRGPENAERREKGEGGRRVAAALSRALCRGPDRARGYPAVCSASAFSVVSTKPPPISSRSGPPSPGALPSELAVRLNSR